MKNVIIGGETYADINRVKLNGVDGKECAFDDTSDATATANDIANGETAYVNGEKITGAMPYLAATVADSAASTSDSKLRLTKTADEKAMVYNGYKYMLEYPLASLGDATAADVAEGKTFTSTTGLKVTGTHVCPTPSGTIEITENGTHDVTNYASANVNVPTEGGIDTSDATATAEDILQGEPAYVNGEKITGNVPFYLSKTFNHGADDTTISFNESGNKINHRINTPERFALLGGSSSRINLNVPTSTYGDATAADVTAGKTFTSSSGLKVNGTMTDNGSVSATLDTGTPSYTIPAGKHSGEGTVSITTESKTATPSEVKQSIYPLSGKVLSSVVVNAIPSNYVDTSDADATAANIQSGRTAYVNGVKITGTHTCSTPSGTLEITENGTHDVTNYASANVNVPSTGIDTSDATATASDMESGVTAYVNGEKVTGTLPHSTQNISISSDPSASGSNVQIKAYASTGKKRIIGDGAALNALVPLSKFGDATADDVVSGKTFTSSAGVKSTGTHTCSGIDTSDATATASDILSGKTAYVNGSKVTGTIASQAAQTITPGTSDKTIASGKYLSGTQTIKGDANLVAGNIKSGVSIFGVTGSYEGSGGGTGTSGNNCEAYVVNAKNPVVNFTRTDGTIKVFGEAIGTSSGYQTPFYAFCGDGYYKASSYGSPSKTSVTWSIDASGKLSGLPSGIASGTIIVTIGV